MHRSIRFPRILLAMFFVAALIAGSIAPLSIGAVKAQEDSAIPATSAYVPATALGFVTANLDASSAQWQQAAVLGERIGQPITPELLVSLLARAVLGSSSMLDAQDFLGEEIAIAVTNPQMMTLLPNVQTGDILSGSSGANVLEAASVAAQSGYVLIALSDDAHSAEIAQQTALRRIPEIFGVNPKEVEQDGITISVIEADEEDSLPGFAIAQVDDAVIAAPTVNDLLPIIELRVNGGESLADLDVLSEVIAPLPDETLALGVINGSMLATDIGPDADKNLPGIDAITNGVNAFTAFSVTAVDNGFQTDSRSLSTNDGEIFGTADAFDPTLIDQMPAETQIYVDGMNFAATGLLDAVGVIASQFLLGALAGMSTATPEATPDAGAMTLNEASNEAFANLALLFGVNLKEQLIDTLDGEYALGIWGIDDADANGVSAAFIAQTSNPASVSATLSSLAMFAGFFGQGSIAVTPTTIGGVTMNTIDLSGSGVSNQIAVGVDDDRLIVGVGDGSETAILGSSERLVHTDLFQAATASLPTERNAMLYINLAALSDPIDDAVDDVTSDDAPELTMPQAFAAVGFKDGDMAGSQGLLYIPA